MQFTNEIGLPDELVPLVERSEACEYASIRSDGTPVTVPLSPVPGVDGRTIDVNTGLAYPTKAERARNNPKVCLLFSDPAGLSDDDPAVALVKGLASVRDADLQANTDRYVATIRATSQSFRSLPSFVLRRMAGYLARIWVEVTPLEVLWWPGGDISVAPRRWQAETGNLAPPSDPPPGPLTERHAAMVPAPGELDASLEHSLENLGAPVLTIVDESGFPVATRARHQSHSDGLVELDIPSWFPTIEESRACLTFHTLEMKKGEMVANENRCFIGTSSSGDGATRFTVERELPSVSFGGGLRGNLALIALMRRLRRRLEPEARRRGQPVPEIRITG